MSSILSSQGMALATAMAVSAGTVILLAFRLQRISAVHHQIPLRSCISSEGKKKKKKNKNKKKVRFADDVVDPTGNGDEFRRKLKIKNRTIDSNNSCSSLSCSSNSSRNFKTRAVRNRGMPENRAVLYSGILRDRLVPHRFAYYSC